MSCVRLRRNVDFVVFDNNEPVYILRVGKDNKVVKLPYSKKRVQNARKLRMN